MIALGQKAEHAMNGVRIRVRTDLQDLVTIERLFVGHNGIFGRFALWLYPAAGVGVMVRFGS